MKNTSKQNNKRYKESSFANKKKIMEDANSKVIIDNLCTFYTNGKENRIQNAQKFEEEYGDPTKGLEDNFKIGISFNKNIVKLYESFTDSDVIISSSLALKLLLTQQNHLAFLSSIEIMILDNANKIYMQNWLHLEEIFAQINIMPKHQDIFYDFELIREYNFDNKQKFFRQTIVYSENNFAELNSLKYNHFSNYKGNVQIKPYYQQELQNLDICIEYMKIELDSYIQDIDVRFDYFINKIWQKIFDDENVNQTAIITNNYFEFIKLRNYFKKTNAFVQCISEYTKKNKAQSKIAKIMNLETPFLLLNERAYYYEICKLKKMKNIIFYSPPKNAFIFRDMISSLQSDDNDGPNLHNRIACIFSNFDQIYLEKLIGTKQSQEFFQSYNKSTTFII